MLCPMMFNNPQWEFPRDYECEQQNCAWFNTILQECMVLTLLATYRTYAEHLLKGRADDKKHS